MATLKRQSASGTWEYIQLTGQDVLSHMNDDNLHNVSVQKIKSDKDSDGVYTVVEYRRKSDNVIVARSTLSGGKSPNYSTRTIQYYKNGVLNKTEIYALTYDSDGELVSEV